ncbi:MAG TPA: hypothetical protein ENN99_08205 [Chloroflexi bacterium]|nr:hypothetical protein [Chloroflexota bacterium]
MLILLQVLIEIAVQILLGMRVPFALAILGAAALAVLLWLATFQWLEIRRMIQIWLVGPMWFFPILGPGFLCAFLYSLSIFLVPALHSASFLFAVSLVAGVILIMFFPRSPSNKWFRWWVPYAVWVYFWWAATRGLHYGLTGILTITLPALVIAELALLIVSNFVLPFPDNEPYRGENSKSPPGLVPTFSQELDDLIALFRYPENTEICEQWIQNLRKALRCLITYGLGTNYPYHVVIDEKFTERTEGIRTWLPAEDKLVKRADGDNFGDFLSGPGIVLTGSDHAVVLSTGLKFKGARGPGLVFTDMSDTPTEVIDLRIQLRAFPAQARTKDGIGVRVVTFIPFQIGAGGQKPKLGEGFPYRTSDVFKAVQAQQVKHQKLTQAPGDVEKVAWYDLPQAVGEHIMNENLSRFEFDDFYAPFELIDNPNDHPRSRIAKNLRDELDKVLPGWGIQRIGGGISDIKPQDPQVIEQRIEAWKADWARQITIHRAAGQSRRLQMVEQARAQAQIDVILSIGEQIEQLRAAGADGIVGYFIDLLENLSNRSQVRGLIPGETGRLVRRLRGVDGIEMGEEYTDAA